MAEMSVTSRTSMPNVSTIMRNRISPTRTMSKTVNTHRRERENNMLYMRTPPTLSWRLDPEESLSDWTLTVVSIKNGSLQADKQRFDKFGVSNSNFNIDENNHSLNFSASSNESAPANVLSTKKYFVHRTQLAVGPRKSEFFSTLFKQKNDNIGNGESRSKRISSQRETSGSSKNGTVIELIPSAAAAFPALLDFIYSPTGTPPDVSTKSAVALRHLASCFGIRELFNDITSFIKKDLTPQTAPIYLLEAKLFQHQRLISAAIEICAKNLKVIKLTLLAPLAPALMEEIIQSPYLRYDSECLSSKIASYCRCRPNDMSLSVLKSLTDSSIMPKIISEESLFYLKLLLSLSEDRSYKKSVHPGDANENDLYNRCVTASPPLVRLALRLDIDEDKLSKSEARTQKAAKKDYNALPPEVKVELLEEAITWKPSNGDDGNDDDNDLKKSEGEKEFSIRKSSNNPGDDHTRTSEIHRVRKKAEKLEDELKQLQYVHSQKVTYFTEKLAAKEAEVITYAGELSKFARVPNSFRVADTLRSCTFQQHSQYNEYGESVYGQDPPSALPLLMPGVDVRTDNECDGWVMREERDGGEKSEPRIWPMYFYKGY